MRIPKNVVLEVTNKCNLACKGCLTLTDDYPQGFMDEEFFKSVIDRINFETILVPYANGEPLLHPEINSLMDYVMKRCHDLGNKGVKMTTYITTNATIWNEHIFRLMLTEQPWYYQTIFSLDGWPVDKSRSIEKARPGSNRQVVLGNIHKFLNLKKELGSKLAVGIKICERGQDYEEIEEYINYWLQQEGIDFVIVGKLLTNDNTGGMRIFPCQYSDDTFMLIRWDQTASLCMYNDAMVNKQAMPLPRLLPTDDLIEFYNNEEYTTFRENQKNGIFKGPCENCGFAYTGSGFRGVINFRGERFTKKPIFYHEDYYNRFYSLRETIRPDSYYGWKA